jgi:hypothetical protein
LPFYLVSCFTRKKFINFNKFIVKCEWKKMLNEGIQIHNFISSSSSGTVINYCSGSDFLTSYGSGSGSTSQKVTVPMAPGNRPKHWTKVKWREGTGPVVFAGLRLHMLPRDPNITWLSCFHKLTLTHGVQPCTAYLRSCYDEPSHSSLTSRKREGGGRGRGGSFFFVGKLTWHVLLPASHVRECPPASSASHLWTLSKFSEAWNLYITNQCFADSG